MFDLNTLDVATPSETPFDLQILHPVTKEPTPLFIQILGKESSTFRDAVRRETNAALRRDFETKRKGKDAKPQTIEEIEGRSTALLAACTVGWFMKGKGEAVEKSITLDGQQIPFSAAAAEKLYDDPRFADVRRQVDEGIGELENFLGR